MTGEIKYCNDCKWNKPSYFIGFLKKGRTCEFDECLSPQNFTDRLVCIKDYRRRDVKYCDSARQYSFYCGKDAKWFEAKEKKL